MDSKELLQKYFEAVALHKEVDELESEILKRLQFAEAIKAHALDQGWGTSDCGIWLDFFVHENSSDYNIVKDTLVEAWNKKLD